jgi:peptide/nickel transport system substrate-binding protein
MNLLLGGAIGVAATLFIRDKVDRPFIILNSGTVRLLDDEELTYGNNTIMQQVFELVQAMGAEAGFDISLRPTEFAALQSTLKAGDFEVGQSGWSGRVDPDGNIHQYVTCEGSLNDVKYCNEDVDRLLNESRLKTDPSARKALYDEAQAILREEMPIIYLFYLPWPFVHKAGIEGFRAYPDGMIRLEGVRFAG